MITALGYKMLINITSVKMISKRKAKIRKALGSDTEKCHQSIIVNA